MGGNETNGVDVFALRKIFDHLYTNVYITDIADDKIVFMNKTMRETFGIEHPEGCICWKVLQKDMEGRCSFCKIDTLVSDKDREVCVWNEENTATEKIYKNYDSLFEWNGKWYHIQHSIDVTRQIRFSETAILDELTGMLNRKAGKERLEQYLERGRKEQKPLVAALYDINELKLVNDRYGHSEGDALLSRVAVAAKGSFGSDDFGMRLSGDEFVLIYYDAVLKEADFRMNEILERLDVKRAVLNLPYELSFSYGLAEVYPGEQCSAGDILSKADERMYIQKRNYHIKRAKESVLGKGHENSAKKQFEFNKEHLYHALTESTDDYVFVGNMKTGVFQYSSAMVEEFGLPGNVIENAAVVWEECIHPDDKAAFLESNQEIADGRTDYHNIEYRAKNVRGEWIWLRCRGKLMRDEEGRPELFAGFISCIGIQNKLDYLTGLYNRFEFEGSIKKHLANGEVKNLGIMLLNLDGFNNINDLYNHSFGDDILKISAQKLLALIPSNAKAFRMDGDEFAILLVNSNLAEVKEIYKRVQQEFGSQQEYNGRKYYCTMSAGYASFPKDADNFLGLMKYANYSLERSKMKGKNRLTIFSENILQDKAKRLEMTELLRESIMRGFVGFSLCYQPQVKAETGALYGAEALARWHCDEYGDVSPGEFIPILEDCGLIVQLGRWVIKEALTQCEKWVNIWPQFRMSINLSYQQLMEDNVLECVREMLEETGTKPSAVTMELTETYLVKENVVARYVMEGLQKMGLQTAMDDFGTGYSSLFSLKNIPVNIVKIDKEFSKGVSKDIFNVTFIKAITDLCHNTGKKVCLEGIETKEEYNIIKSNTDLELIQGYYFGRPMKTADFEKAFCR